MTAKITQSAAVTDAEVQQAYKEQNVKVKVAVCRADRRLRCPVRQDHRARIESVL